MSQIYETLISGTTPFAQLYGKVNNMAEALRSAFSGTAFPTSPAPVEGQFCYRTDQDKLYVYVNNTWKEVAIESTGLGAELINARGTKPTLDQRLDVALNEDGTLKASTSLNPSQWANLSGQTFTYISATNFTVTGDQRDIYKPTRRLKINLAASVAYSEVVSSSYDNGQNLTTVNIYDAVLDNTLVSVEHSLFLPQKDNGALSPEMIANERVVLKSSNYTTIVNDSVILCDASENSFTVTVLSASAAGAGKRQTFKKIDLSNNAVNINYGNKVSLTRYGETLEIISDGTNWFVVDDLDQRLFTYDVFPDFVVSGLLGIDPGATLTMTTPGGKAYVNGKRIDKPADDPDLTYTYPALSDTYDYLRIDKTIVHQSVANGAAEPTQPFNTIKLQKVVTNATEITNVVDLRPIIGKASQTPGTYKIPIADINGTLDSWVSNVVELISEVNVNNVTQVNFTGLDSNTYKHFILVVQIKNPTASATPYYLFVNGDNTITNYHAQYIAAVGTTVSADRPNSPLFMSAVANEKLHIVAHIGLSDGYFFYHSVSPRYTTLPTFMEIVGEKDAAVSTINSLTIQSSISNAITGKIRLFGVK